MFFGLLKGLAGNVLGGVLDHFKSKRELKRAIELAKIERVNKLDTSDVDWDQIMAENSKDSWKDEWFTILLSVPAIMAFIPSLSEYVLQGFEALSTVPEWYRLAFGTAVAAAFGRNEVIKWFKKAPVIKGKPKQGE